MVFTTVNRAGLPIVKEGNIEPVSQPTSQPASSYSTSSYGISPTGTSGSTISTSTSGTSTTTGGSTTSTYTTHHTTPVTLPTNNPASSYSIPRTPPSEVVAQYPSAPKTTTPPQTVASQPSVTVPQVTETTTTTPTGVTHLWIGWKIEPWEEEIIQKFIEAFEHGKHVHHPIELPPMGGVLAPIPGAPAPGAPLVTMQPQEASNQYQLTA